MRLYISALITTFLLVTASNLPGMAQDGSSTQSTVAADELKKLQTQIDSLTAAVAENNKAAKASADAAAQSKEASEASAKVAKDASTASIAAQKNATQAAAATTRLNALKPPSAVQTDSPPGSRLLSDYVPCRMDRKDIYGLRGANEPLVSTLDANQFNDLVSSVGQNLKMESLHSANDTFDVEKYNSKIESDPTIQSARGTGAYSVDIAKRLIPKIASQSGALQQGAETATQNALSQIAGSTLYDRPADVGCSMSIYPWNISRMVFGRSVAKNYLAVQIVVRNLNQDSEFLIHDAELAVDAYSGQLERFQASHEKEAVRGVVVYGQNYDRHAYFAHGAEAIGIILGAVVGIPSSNDILTAATGAYSAGFIPSFQKLFPDLTTQNLNNVNDLAFSAASASRIVVPKGGSVPFVVFIPVEPLEQACWLQKGYTPSADIGIATACDSIFKTDGTRAAAYPSADSATVQRFGLNKGEIFNGSWTTKTWPYEPKKVPYKNWSSLQLTALQKHAYAVIAGAHIREAQATALRSISCTNSTDRKVHIALLSGKPMTCNLAGADLDTATTLRARSVASPLSAPIDAALTTSGDSTVATASFSADAVKNFTDPSYSLYSVDKSGAETDLKQQLNILPSPVIDATNYSPTTVAALNVNPYLLTVPGKYLSQVSKFNLVSTVDKTQVVAAATVDPTSTDTALKVKFAPADVTKLTAPPYSVILVVDPDTKATYDPNITFPIH